MTRVDKLCVQCNRAFQPRRRDQKYCSNSCKQKSARLRKRGSVPQRCCPHCGKEIPKESRANMRFCTPKCRQRFHDAAKLEKSDPLEYKDTTEQLSPEVTIKDLPPPNTDSPPIEQQPQPPVELYTPTELLKRFCEIASEYEHVTVDTVKLKELLDAIASAPAPASEIFTDDIIACFQAKPGTCLITASFRKADNLTHKIPDVISEVKEQIRFYAWEAEGDLVFVVSDIQPEWTAIRVREIMLQIGGCRSIRLCRGSAWGSNDWKLPSGYYSDEHIKPEGWDDNWWTD